MTDTEREANLQAALSRAANHRAQPGDWDKLGPAWTAAFHADTPQNPRIDPYVDPRATQTPSQVPDSPETSQGATEADT